MNSTPLTDQPILAYGIALGIGLLIGAERERRKGIGPTRSPNGHSDLLHNFTKT